MTELQPNRLFDRAGACLAWRDFCAVLVAANFDTCEQLSGVQLLVGYQTRPGAARVQTTADGLKQMLAKSEKIVIAKFDADHDRWITGAKLLTLSAEGDIVLEGGDQVLGDDGFGELPSFLWLESPQRKAN